jgi:hypothetical protein
MVTRDLYTAWDSKPLKRRSYPRVEDKKYPVFTKILTTIVSNLFPNVYTIRITPLSARVFVLTVNTF